MKPSSLQTQFVSYFVFALCKTKVFNCVILIILAIEPKVYIFKR
jgi:hypothetical protein